MGGFPAQEIEPDMLILEVPDCALQVGPGVQHILKQGRLDYPMKKEKYFKKIIDTCPNSLRVLNKYEKWTPQELKENQEYVVTIMCEHHGITRSVPFELED